MWRFVETGGSTTIEHRCVTHLYGSNSIQPGKCYTKFTLYNLLPIIIEFATRLCVHKNHVANKFTYYPIACFKSSIKSSASSIPTLNRMRESVKPFFKRSSRGIDAWVIVAG